MSTERYRLEDLLDSPASMDEIAARLSEGAVCVYPTETVYGIGGRGDSEAVRRRIFDAKRRTPENPLILIAANRESFETLDLLFPPVAERLAAAFWPGNLTLVLPRRSGASPVGVRVSGHPFIAALGVRFGIPLFSSSANISGQPYDGDPDRLYRSFAGAVDFMVDAGVLPPSLPSTVVRVGEESGVEVLREGAIGRVAIETVAGPGAG